MDLEPDENIETLCYKYVTLVLLLNPTVNVTFLPWKLTCNSQRATGETTSGT